MVVFRESYNLGWCGITELVTEPTVDSGQCEPPYSAHLPIFAFLNVTIKLYMPRTWLRPLPFSLREGSEACYFNPERDEYIERATAEQWGAENMPLIS